MTQAQLLADTFAKTRQLTKFYLSKLKDENPEQVFKINGKKFNSIYWIVAHLIWAEDNLAIAQITGKSEAAEWVKHFAIHADGSLPENKPDFKTVLNEMKRIHELALNTITALSDEQLSEQNTTGFHFGDGDSTKRMMIQHCIRHEGTHLGQISLLAKLYGKQTI